MPDDPTLDEELQQIFEAEVAREPTPPPAAPEEPPVPAVVDPLIDRENRRISMESSLHEGQTTPTQDAVDATTIAHARGLPSEGVFADIERSRVSYAAQGLAAMIDVDMSPATADFIANPIHAALVDQEDVANMTTMEFLVKTPQIKVAQTLAQVIASAKGFKEASGFGSEENRDSIQYWESLAQLGAEQELPGWGEFARDPIKNWSLPFKRVYLSGAEQAPHYIGAGGGGVIGAGIGALAAGSAGTAVAPGPGTAAGTVGGAAFGAWGYTYVVESGALYNQLSTHVDPETGNTLDKNEAAIGAHIGGTLIGGVELIGLAIPWMRPMLKSAGRAAAVEAITTVIKRPTVRRAIARNIITPAVSSIGEGLTEITQELLQFATEDILKSIDPGEWSQASPRERKAQLKEVFIKAAEGAFLPGAAGGLSGYQSDMRDVRRSEAYVDQHEMLRDTARGSKLREKAPAAYRKHIEMMRKKYGSLENVFISIEEWNKAFGEDARRIANEVLKDEGKAYAEASLVPGAELVIPAEDYLTVLAPDTELSAKIDPHIKLSQRQKYTKAQLNQRRQEIEAAEREAIDSAKDRDVETYDPEQRKFYDIEYRKGLAAGFGAEHADSYAKFQAEVAVNMAERSGMPLAKFYGRYEVTVQRQDDLGESPLVTPDGRAVNRLVDPSRAGVTPDQEEVRRVVHGIERRDEKALTAAAAEMAGHVSEGQTLVPAPDADGSTTTNRRLAEAIAANVEGVQVRDVLLSNVREPQDVRRSRGELGAGVEDIETTLVEPRPLVAGEDVVEIESQEVPGGDPIRMFNLNFDMPGHRAGSTVSLRTLERAGYSVVEKADPKAATPATLAGQENVVLIDSVRRSGATIESARRVLPGSKYLTYAQGRAPVATWDVAWSVPTLEADTRALRLPGTQETVFIDGRVMGLLDMDSGVWALALVEKNTPEGKRYSVVDPDGWELSLAPEKGTEFVSLVEAQDAARAFHGRILEVASTAGRRGSRLATPRTPSRPPSGEAISMSRQDDTVRPDGSLPGNIKLNQTREWREWIEKFRGNKLALATFGERELNNLERGMEMTALIFGDMSLLPEETLESPIRGNSDFFKKTFDITTVCPRQDQFVATITTVERNLGRILSPMERHLVGIMMQEMEVDPSCWYCYGQAGRNEFDWQVAKLTTIADRYVAAKQAGKRMTANATRTVFDGWKPDGVLGKWLKKNWKQYAGWRADGTLDEVKLRDLIRDFERTDDEGVAEFAKMAGSAVQGGVKANAPKPWGTLREQIIRLGTREDTGESWIEFFNSFGGMRMNSQTDFRPWHVIEVAEFVAAMQAKGGMAHVYTKETDFIRIFGRTGIKFSASLTYEMDRKTGRMIYDYENAEEFNERWRPQLKDLRVHINRDGDIVLDMIEVDRGERKQGIGTRVLEDLVAWADAQGRRVRLTPALRDDIHGTTSRSRLVKFYKRFGFVENKGRKKDFTINADEMYREPDIKRRQPALPRFDGSRGMVGEEYIRLRREYGNVGGMVVALTEEQLKFALEDPRVDMIIPYHRGAITESISAFEHAKDFSKEQNDKWPKRYKENELVTVTLDSGEEVNILGRRHLSREYHHNNRERYLEICDKLGITPRFKRFRDHRNYMRLIIDVARNPNEQQVLNTEGIDWDAADEVTNRWVDEDGDKIEADPNITGPIMDRILNNDWPEGAVTPDGKTNTAPRTDFAAIENINEEIALNQSRAAGEEGVPQRRPADPATFNGEPFYMGVASTLDGVIEETYTFQRAEEAQWLHRSLAGLDNRRAIEAGEKIMFWITDDGVVEFWDSSLDPEGTIARQISQQIELRPQSRLTLAQRAWHGSGKEFEKFDLKFMSTGEGAQAYGWGLYFAQSEGVGRSYKTKLSDREHRVKLSASVENRSPSRSMMTTLEMVIEDEVDEIDNFDPNDIGSLEALLTATIQRLAWSLDSVTYTETEKAESDAFLDFLQKEVTADDLTVTVAGPGALFQVELPDQDRLIDWEAPVSDQDAWLDIQRTLIEFGAQEWYVTWTTANGVTQIEWLNDLDGVENSQAGARAYSAQLKAEGIDAEITVATSFELGDIRDAQMNGRDYYYYLVNQIDQLGQSIARADTLGERTYDSLSPQRRELAQTLDAILPEMNRPVERIEDLDNNGRQELVSRYLAKMGIPGHSFFDGMSRSRGEGTRNIVMYDDSQIEVVQTLQQIQRNAPAGTQFRSISVDEAQSIQATGAITGKGSEFSGDTRTGVFTGDTPQDVLHHGEDLNRRMTPEQEARSKEADALRLEARAVSDEIETLDEGSRDRKKLEERLLDLRRSANEIDNEVYAAVYKRAREFRESDPGATSYILELAAPAGGTRFTGPDSRTGRPAAEGRPASEGAVPETEFDRRALTGDNITRALVVKGGTIIGQIDGTDFMLMEDFANPPAEDIKPVQQQRATDPEGGVTGTIDFTARGYKFDITLLRNADRSTLFHETGHYYLEMLGDLFEDTNAPPELVADYKTLLRYLEQKTGDRIRNRDDLYRSQAKWTKKGQEGKGALEVFARAWEEYLMEGRSPSIELQTAFARMRAWLRQVYARAQELVGLTDEVRGVFDRLVATDEQIEIAKQETQAEALEDLQQYMSPEEYEAYNKAVTKANLDAEDRLRKTVMAEGAQSAEKWYRRETARAERDAEQELMQQPKMRALRFLQTGEMAGVQEELPAPLVIKGKPGKLDGDTVEFLVGKAVLMSLPGPHNGGGAYIYSRKGGIDPEVLATYTDHDNGYALINDLVGSGKYADHLQQTTERIMEERFGEIINDPDRLAEEAVDASLNERRSQQILMELRFLRRAMGQDDGPSSVVDRGVLKTMAREHVDRMTVRDVVPSNYQRESAKQARLALEAARKGDWAAAYDAKQSQLWNTEMYRAARDAKLAVDKGVKYLKSMTKGPAQKRIGKAGPQHLDAMNALLDQYELGRESRAEGGVREGVRAAVEAGNVVALQKYLDLMAVKNLDPVLTERLLNEAKKRGYAKITVEHFKDLVDGVKSIEHTARRDGSIKAMGRRFARELYRDQLTERTDAMPPRRKRKTLSRESQSRMDLARERLRGFNASRIKVEELIRQVNGGYDPGPMDWYYWDLLAKAQADSQEMEVQYLFNFIEALQKLDKKKGRTLYDPTIEVEYGDGESLMVSRAEILAMALNWGNEENISRLLGGGHKDIPQEYWDEFVTTAMTKLERDDWAFVQETWDMLESLWPQLEAFEKRMTGVAPPHIERRPFTVALQDGTTIEMQGGYYPAVYDPEQVLVGQKQEDSRETPGGLFQSGRHGFALPLKSHLKGRIEGFTGPIKLEIGVIPRHLQQVIHDLTHREALIEANKFITDNVVRSALIDKLGKENYDQFIFTLKRIAAAHVPTAAEGQVEWVESALRATRIGLTYAVMGFKSTVTIVNLLNIFSANELIKRKYLVEGANDFRRNGIEATVAEVHELSGEMKFRFQNIEREAREFIDNMIAKKKPTWWDRHVNKYAYLPIVATDAAVAYPAWIGAYRQALAEGSTDTDAVKVADRKIRLTLSAGGLKDQVHLQGANRSEWYKNMTIFFSWFAMKGSRYIALHYDWRRAKHEGAQLDYWLSVPHRMFSMVLADAILGAYIMRRGPEDEDEEGVLGWTEWALKEVAYYTLSTFPFGREIAAMAQGFTPRASSYTALLEEIWKAGEEISDAIEGEDVNKERLIRHAWMAAAIKFKLGGAKQIENSIRGLMEVMQEDDASMIDAAGRITYGPLRRGERRKREREALEGSRR